MSDFNLRAGASNGLRSLQVGRRQLQWFLRDASLRDAPQDEVLDPHGEERFGVYHRAALRADPLARLEP